MSTEAIDRSRGATADDTSERAQRAVKVFRGMQHGLSAYAKAITGNRKVRVEISSGPPHTDGKVIYYRPPIELGDKTNHDRFLCDKRGEDKLHLCPACKVREEVLVNIYHEISHIAFGTFTETSDEDRKNAIDEAIKEWGGKYEEKIRKQMNNAPASVVSNYLGLAGLISPYLPHLFNCLEDARVDSAMFRARKGTRKMMEADTFNLLSQGIPDGAGNYNHQKDAPLNSQVALGCYFQAAGYVGWEEYLHDQIGEHVADAQIKYLLDQVAKAQTAASVYRLAFPILARLRELGYFQLDDDEEEQGDEPEDQKQDDPTDNQAKSKDEADASEAGSEDDDSSSDGEHSGSEPESGEESEDSSDSSTSEDSDTSDDSGDASGDSEDEPQEGGEGDSEGESEGGLDSGSGEEDSSGDASEHGGSSSESDDSSEQEDGAGQPSEGSEEGEGSSEAGTDEAEGGSEVNDSDQDSVPEESGDAGQSAEGNGSSDVEEQSSDGADGKADSSEQSQDSGSPQEGGDSLGENNSERPDSQNAGDVTEGSNQLVDSEGDGEAGKGSSEVSADSRPDESSLSDGSDEDQSERNESQSTQEVPGSDDPELVDSGADQGLGGIGVEESAPANYGNPDDVVAATEHMHSPQGEPQQLSITSKELEAIAMAVIQGIYFETPSYGVGEVYEHEYSPDAHGWDSSKFTPVDKVRYGIDCDMDIPEQILGPALLKTRRIFSDNQTAILENNLRSGRVNGKVLGKRAWNDDDRLFGKKRIPGKRNYAVLIGIDISSSNMGSNLALVKRAAFAQAELCHRVGVEFQIVAHSCSVSGGQGNRKYVMHLHHIKGWNEPWDSLTKKRISELVAVGGNLDGHALEFMRKQLGKVEATDKILLYYTDGKMPAANMEEEREVLERQIKLCKRDQITLLGVGMGTDSPERHGLDTVQVDDDSDLAGVVEHLGKRLLRRAR